MPHLQDHALVSSPQTFLLLLFFFLSSIVKKSFPSHKPRLTLPPSPPKLSFIGNLHQLGPLPHHSLHAISSKYGELVLLHLGRIPALVVSSADMAHEIMRTHDLIFASRPVIKAAEILLYNCRSLNFSPYGDHWRHLRKLSTVHLLSAKRVQSYRSQREEEAASLTRRVRQASQSCNRIDMSEELLTFSNDVICRVVFGKFFGEEESRQLFRILIEENVMLFGEFWLDDYIPWLWWLGGESVMSARAKRNAKIWDDLLKEVIKEHEEGCRDGGEDFVDVLLSLRKDPDLVYELREIM